MSASDNSNSGKVVGFYHVGVLHCWKEVNEEIIGFVRDIGLLDRLEKLYFGVVGTGNDNEGFELPFEHPKIEIIYQSPNVREFEHATTQQIEDFAHGYPDYKILHFHNAGVKNGKRTQAEYADPKYPWWRWWEMYHTLERYEECISLLDEYDACGIEIQNDPYPHFSGTWWWANASYINRLISVEQSKMYNPDGIYYDPNNMHGAEFWIGLSPGYSPRWKSLCQTGFHWIERQKAIEEHVKPELSKLTNKHIWSVMND